MLGSWKEGMEGKRNGMKEDWTTERRKLLNVKADYEKRLGSLEERVSDVGLRLETKHAMGSTPSSGNVSSKMEELHVGRHGLVTPPSHGAGGERLKPGRNGAPRVTLLVRGKVDLLRQAEW